LSQKKKISLARAQKVTEYSGSGIESVISGKKVLVGNLTLMTDKKIPMPTDYNHKDNLDTITFVAINNEVAGLITFDDTIRPEAKKTLDRLRELGFKHMILITGDVENKAKMVAKKLGITEIKADALPGDKIRAIEAQTHKPVVFVGDGVNDAPVLTSSDVGIALGAQGQTAASESADMVIMLNDFSKVAKAREIASRTFKIAQQSIVIGIAMSIVLMFIFSTGKFKPVYGALLQELVDVFVIFNALRAHGTWKKVPTKRA
jgi:P-type E1-E2 ATPase